MPGPNSIRSRHECSGGDETPPFSPPAPRKSSIFPLSFARKMSILKRDSTIDLTAGKEASCRR